MSEVADMVDQVYEGFTDNSEVDELKDQDEKFLELYSAMIRPLRDLRDYLCGSPE